MEQSEHDLYQTLKQHVTGLFRVYSEFCPNKGFWVSLDTGGSLLCEVVDHNMEQGYSDEYVPVYIVFKCGVCYYKLEGYKHSYGGLEWDSHLTRVDRKEKVVYLYE